MHQPALEDKPGIHPSLTIVVRTWFSKIASFARCTVQRGGSRVGCAVVEQTDSEEVEPDQP